MGFTGEAVEDFDFIFGDASTDIDTEGDTGEVRVLEFHARALRTVVDQHGGR